MVQRNREGKIVLDAKTLAALVIAAATIGTTLPTITKSAHSVISTEAPQANVQSIDVKIDKLSNDVNDIKGRLIRLETLQLERNKQQ